MNMSSTTRAPPSPQSEHVDVDVHDDAIDVGDNIGDVVLDAVQDGDYVAQVESEAKLDGVKVVPCDDRLALAEDDIIALQS